MLLPKIDSFDAYRQVYRQEQVWRPAMQEICNRHSLDAQQMAFAPPGTHVVFSVGSKCYIKLFSPLWAADYTSERLVLETLASRSHLPVPYLLHEGQIEAWPYVILSTIPGVPLNQVWSELNNCTRQQIVRACGNFLAELHRVPLDDLDELTIDWSAFVEARIAARVEQLGSSALGSLWSHAVSRLFESQRSFLEAPFEPTLLCADLTDEHVMVCRQDKEWSFSGIIDFGDAMVGHPLYEFAAPACSITLGDRTLLTELFAGYGFDEAYLTESFADRLLAYMLLHRYIDIGELLEVFGADRIDTLYRLKERLWPFARHRSP